MDIENALQAVTDKFTSDVLEALRAHGHELIDEMFGEAPDDEAPAPRARTPRAAKTASKTPRAPKGAKKASKSASGRLARRTPEEIGAAVGKVVSLLKKHPNGLRAEEIREATGLSTKEMPRVMHQGVADKAFRISGGQKRSTTYSVGAGRGKPARASKKASGKPARAAKASGKGKTPKGKKAAKKARGASKKGASKAKASPKGKALNGAAHPAPAVA